MDRKSFLVNLGMLAATVTASRFVTGCSKDSDTTAPPAASKIDFTLDLSQPENSALKVTGGVMYKENIIIAKVAGDRYTALGKVCRHQAGVIQYQHAEACFRCPAHGSTFDLDGNVTAGPSTLGLPKYRTSLNGTMLRIYE